MLVSVQIPGIEIEAELGHGAHSVVYRARQGSTPCAVKLPRRHGRWTRWVYREAVALARVRHPCLPKVYEVGEVDDLPYLVMELVLGETLGDRLERGTLTERSALDIAEHLASGLAVVHDAGLVHRDVKPRNILLDEKGTVRLVDFGFATPLERVESFANDAAGTPAYAAPEQLQTPARVDARADLYGLGRVLIEALTGKLPPLAIIGDRSQEEAIAEMTEAGIASSLCQIVGHLLATSPEDRYCDARALLQEIALVRLGAAPRGPSAYEPDRRVPFVGREAELDRLVRSWDDLGAVGRVVFLRGVRGSGKTRLLGAYESTLREVERGHRIFVACRDGDPPLAVLRRIFEGYIASVRHAPEAARVAAEDALRAAATDDVRAFITLIAPSLSSVLGPARDAPLGASASFAEAAANVLVRLGRLAGPLLIAVDDLQWADPASRDVLVRFAHRANESSALLVLASRGDASSVAKLERFSRIDQAHVSTLELTPLRERQVAALVAAHLGETRIEPGLAQRAAALADGTPLGVLEVLGALLDAGAVRPHAGAWALDIARAERVTLPEGALALFGRRLVDMPPATRTVLDAAAVLGTSFEEAVLGPVVGIPVEDLAFALADGRRAGLLQEVPNAQHRFLHESLREMLLAALSERERRLLHQSAAEVLDARGGTSLEALCATAAHYAEGDLPKQPFRAYRASRAAAAAALERFDNETAIHFLEFAKVASEAAGRRLDAGFHRSLGEAQLRLAVLDESLHSFGAALLGATDPVMKATILGRIAWVHQTAADPDRAWEALERAFESLGVRMPKEDAFSAAETAKQLASGGLRHLLPNRSIALGDSRQRIEVACDLHYQNARLGLEYNKPFRLVQSAIQALEVSRALGHSPALARSLALHAFVMTALGRKGAGAAEIAEARDMAEQIGAPVTSAFCAQVMAMTASWSGDVDLARELFGQCLHVHGSWLELSEYCHDAAAAEQIETARGNASAAWVWIELTLRRFRRSQGTTPFVAEYLVHRARAALATMGRTVDDGDPLLANSTTPERRGNESSFYKLLSWGPRARFFLERGDLGIDFERFVASFESEKLKPRSVHLAVVEYYMAVAHARLHQCLRASRHERVTHLPALRKAQNDLTLAARIPILRAHAALIEGSLAWLEGHPRKAKSAFAEAEALARKHGCSWVLHSIARVRAHQLRDEGSLEAARDQARIAEMLAREHGAETRARWVREDFGLAPPVPDARANSSSSAQASKRARRQVAALIQVVRVRAPESRPDQQATAVLDDLVRSLGAERGALWFQPDLGAPARILLGRTRTGESAEIDGWREDLLHKARNNGEPWPPDAGSRASFEVDGGVDEKRVLAAPLFVYDRAAGAVLLERAPAAPAFVAEDRELLTLLAQQAPVALEIARLLVEREQLQASLQHAQKMEAVGQLAGGVAHDFNNMLMAMQASVTALRDRLSLDVEGSTDLDVIANAARRATELTRQLLAFSRHRPAPLSPHDVNEALAGLESMLRRLIGDRVALTLDLDAPHVVKLDRAAFEQAVVNLAVNARDAMPDGGALTITARAVTLDEAAVRRGAPKMGEYVQIAVRDTGQGIEPELIGRVFEPFFTTKAPGVGTGLGLAMVYTFAKNCGGYVDVTSEVGRGTTFALNLPKSDGRATRRKRAPLRVVARPPAASPKGAETILVVDDEELVRRTIRRILERSGYNVLLAGGAADALELARARGPEISLVLLDVLMPGVTGPELGQRLAEMRLPAKLLYMSGFAPDTATPDDLALDTEVLLQKPFTPTDLLDRMRRLLDN